MSEVTKAIIPISGFGTRFLPITKAVPKELLSVADKPLLHYALEELRDSGAREICFVVGGNKKAVGDYLKRSPQLERVLEEKGREDLLESLRELDELVRGFTVTFVSDPRPGGDGATILLAKKFAGQDPCFVVYPDDLVESDIPASLQLVNVFKTSQRPVTALYRLPQDQLSSYGVVACDRIARRLFKIKEIVEKPKSDAPSDLAILGRRIITPEVFDYLKALKPNERGEITLSEALGSMTMDGAAVYGFEIDGTWWECGSKKEWLRTNLHYSLKHPEYGKALRAEVRGLGT